MKYEMVIETTEQIHALSHPLRQRILSILTFKELTNKQIAELLEESPPKVYFHVKELLNAGIIQLTREAGHGSIVEKYYTASARSFRLSPSLELAKVDEHFLYESAFHETYRNLIESLDYHKGTLPDSHIVQQKTRLTEKQFSSIVEHLSAIDEILNQPQLNERDNLKDSQLYSMSYFLHPAKSNNGKGE